jgi:uncharacterized membrane protein YqjE
MAPHDESIPDLIRGTIRDGMALVRDEVVLVRTELAAEYARIKGGLITAMTAAVAGVLAAVMLLGTIAWGVVDAFEWPPWAGYATVSLPLLVIALVLGMRSKTMLSRDRYLPKTTETLKENAQWIRARTQS